MASVLADALPTYQKISAGEARRINKQQLFQKKLRKSLSAFVTFERLSTLQRTQMKHRWHADTRQGCRHAAGAKRKQPEMNNWNQCKRTGGRGGKTISCFAI
jgi:hypothetical protein